MSLHPYDCLTPDVVLDALASTGLYGDGRLMGLSSYENRVYLIHLEEPCEGHDAVVAKFYRPGRWSQAQILEEHAFARELTEAEIPAVGPLRACRTPRCTSSAALTLASALAAAAGRPNLTIPRYWSGSAASWRASTPSVPGSPLPPDRRSICRALRPNRATGC